MVEEDGGGGGERKENRVGVPRALRVSETLT